MAAAADDGANARPSWGATGNASNAAWWDDRVWASPSAPGSIPPPTPSDCKAFAAHFHRLRRSRGRSPFRANGGDLYRRVLERRPACSRATTPIAIVTLIHGDAHVWNVLMAQGRAKRPTSGWFRLGHLAYRRPRRSDLAYMMAMHWYPDLEAPAGRRPLLDRYHAALLGARASAGYDRRALDDDYRLSVPFADPDARLGRLPTTSRPWIWWKQPRTHPARGRRSRLPRGCWV